MGKLTEARRKAWETRRKLYGQCGHRGTYSRVPAGTGDPVGMLNLIIRLLAEGTLSEGQVARATGLDRITIRRLEDERPTGSAALAAAEGGTHA